MVDLQLKDNIKQAFEGMDLPDIDVRVSVMKRIYDKKTVKWYCNTRRLLTVMTLTVSLLFIVGFAGKQILNLKGVSGNPYTFILSGSKDEAVVSILSQENKKLSPGQTLVHMKVKNNTDNIFSFYTKPIAVSSTNELYAKLGKDYKAPSYITEGFSFKEGSFEYGYNKFPKEEMIEECKTTDKQVVIRVLEPSKDISGYKIIYSNGKELIDFKVWSVDKPTDSFGKDIQGQSFEKINIKDFEAVYIKGTGDRSGNYEISWLNNSEDKAEVFSVRYVTSSKISSEQVKGELIKIAESIK
jgi:hypothetical protein